MTDQRDLLLTPASQIPTRRQAWLWAGRIPLGTTTIFAGRGGEGKSTFALYLAALINKGELEGDLHGNGYPVLIVSHEDDWSTVMNPRLIGAGANLDHVYQVKVRMTIDETTSETVPAFPIDLQLIRDAVEQTGARMIIIDPITSTISGDLHKVTDVRRALDPLTQLAQALEIAVIGIMHFNKGTGNASDKLSGSHGFRDAVRSVLLFATDDETGQRVVTLDKANYSQDRGASFAFNLISTPVYTDDGACSDIGVVQYLGDTDVTVSDIINRTANGDAETVDDRNAAQAFLLDYLRDRDGYEAAASDVIKAGRAAGFSEQEIKDARRRCRNPRVASQKSGGRGIGWVWAISPEGGTKGGEGGTVPNPATFATFTPPLTQAAADDKEVAPVSYLDYRPAIIDRADMTCPVCSEPVSMNNPGYCDTIDTAHANYRADHPVTA
ncbi:AAA family ATPase [Microbacterium sp. SD291]|uniref:AAA family ATPase n=1 Tax=Microbacterium sp. SD291 TaxID=2782007 RepID=UPI001A956CC0|nr:AAA family ATPase [Microbacterium sp. SD291]MBO0979900.1 AAA family ATPase [Microbacterium sp. SD291]